MIDGTLLWLGWYGLFLTVPLLVAALAVKDWVTRLARQRRAARDH